MDEQVIKNVTALSDKVVDPLPFLTEQSVDTMNSFVEKLAAAYLRVTNLPPGDVNMSKMPPISIGAGAAASMRQEAPSARMGLKACENLMGTPRGWRRSRGPAH